MASSVLKVADATSTALLTCNAYYDFPYKITGNNSHLKALRSTISDVSDLLSSLHSGLGSCVVRDSLQVDKTILYALEKVQQPLEDCTAIFASHLQVLKGCVKPRLWRPSDLVLRTRITAFSCFRHTELKVLCMGARKVHDALEDAIRPVVW